MGNKFLLSFIFLLVFANNFAQNVANVAQVSNEVQFKEALLNANITRIEVQNDIDFATTGGDGSGEVNIIIPTRSIDINGNNHIVDFHHYSSRMNNPAIKVDVIVENIKMYGQNYWGPFRLENVANGSRFKYKDVYYEGSQVTASYLADVFIDGEVEVKSVNRYLRPLVANRTASTQSGGNQQNFEVTNVTFMEGSKYTGSTFNGVVLDLRNGGHCNILKGAKVSLTGNGNSGEGEPTTFYLQGDLLIEEGAELNVIIPSFTKLPAGGDSTTPTTRGGIFMTDNATITVKSGAELNITHDGYPNNAPARALIRIGTNSSVLVEDKASLSVHATNTRNNNETSLIRAMAGSKFIIGEKANFDISAKGTGNVRLINIAGGSSVFEFKDANLVSLDLTGNTNSASRLINMGSGRFKADVQKVTTTNRSNNIETVYTPMYAMDITYSGVNVTAVEARSSNAQLEADFKNNYRTQNFNKVVFEYIPDITLKMPGLGDNVNRENSHIIKGNTIPGVYVQFSSDQYSFPEGAFPGEDHEVNNRNFHAIADADGNFSYTLPVGDYFTAGDEINVYATKDGKTLDRTLVVIDETAPAPALINEIIVGDSEITGQAEGQSIVTILNTDISSNTEIQDLIAKINAFYNVNYDDLLFAISNLGDSPEDMVVKEEKQAEVDAILNEFAENNAQLNDLLKDIKVSSTTEDLNNMSVAISDFTAPAPEGMSLGDTYWAIVQDKKGNISVISQAQTVKNKFINVSTTVVWVDVPEGVNTPAVTLQLQQDGVNIENPIAIAENATASDLVANWNNLPLYNEETKERYNYTVIESKLPQEYSSSVLGNVEAGFEVTYTYDETNIGIDKIKDIINLNVYPNPVNSILNIESDKNIKSVELFNILGKSIIHIDANMSTNFQVNMTNFESGIYILRVVGEEGTAVLKVVKQ